MAFSTHDQVPDSPTNVFATLNLLYPSSISVSDGNLTTGTFLASAGSVTSSMQMLSNAITYFEIYYETSYSDLVNIGLMENYNSASSWGIRGDGEPWNNAPQTAVSISFAAGDVLGVIVDVPNNKWYLAKNGLLQLSANISNGTGYIHNNLTSNLSLRCWNASSSGDQKIRVNFGQDSSFGGYPNSLASSSGYADANGYGSFYYSPPTGALALCTANLPDPDIDPALDDLPEDYFKAVTYIGNGAATSTGASNTISIGMPADLIWIKERDTASVNHHIVDTVRGIGTGRYNSLASNNTNQQTTSEVYSGVTGGVTDIDHTNNEFTVHGRTGWVGGDVNEPSKNYIAWCFRAGGAPTADNTATSGAMTANSVSVDGTLQSSYTPSGSPTIYPTRMSVNTKAGFSIVKVTKSAAQYSYDTYPHGLSKAPDFIITKSLNSSTEHWYCYHSSITPDTGYSARIQLNQSNQATLNSTIWGSPTNITDNIIAWDGAQNLEQIFYCWHSVSGYSKFGSYTGNGSADGPFVYTGFKPAWVMIKNTSATADWIIIDSTRDEFNSNTGHALYPSLAFAEANLAAYTLDLISSGFKIRNTGSEMNRNGNTDTFIYIAFAEQPFKYATAR